MTLKPKLLYEFGAFRFEPDDYRLSEKGREKKLDPKELELLRLLIESRGSLLSKEDLLTALYPDEKIPEAHDASLHVFVSKLRDALGDKEQRLIENVRGKGYRFNGEVQIGKIHVRKWRLVIAGSFASLVVIGAMTLLTAWLSQRGYCPEELSRISPEARKFYFNAERYELSGDDEKALAEMEQAIATDPNFAEAHLRAAYLAYDLDQPEAAATHLAHARELMRTRSAAFRLRVSALDEELKDNDEKALQSYELLVEACPKNTDCLYRFGAFAMEHGNSEEAGSALERCLRIDSQNPFCRQFSMWALVEANRFQDVISESESLKKRGVFYPWMHEPVGLALWGEDRLDEARSEFEELATTNRSRGRNYFFAGKDWLQEVLLSQGKLAEAAEEMGRVDRSDVKADDFVYLANIYALVGDISTSKRYLAKIPKDTRDARTLREAAMASAIIGDGPQTSEFLKRRAAGGAEQLDNAIEHFINGALALREHNSPQEAAKELKLARELEPFNLQITYLVAKAYAAQGDFQSAVPLFRQLIDAKGNIYANYPSVMWAVAHLELAQCLESLGQTDEALSQYNTFVTLWKDADSWLMITTEAKLRLGKLAKQTANKTR